MKFLDIGVVSASTGIRPSALRYYEEIGLISAVSRHGLRRQFPPQVLLQLKLIAMGKAAGFSLEEIAGMFRATARRTFPVPRCTRRRTRSTGRFASSWRCATPCVMSPIARLRRTWIARPSGGWWSLPESAAPRDPGPPGDDRSTQAEMAWRMSGAPRDIPTRLGQTGEPAYSVAQRPLAGKGSRMGSRPGLNAVLRLAALICCLPAMATAEEKLGWHGQKGEHDASLFYGIPQTDHAPLSFSCAQGCDALTFTFAFAPINAVDGVEVEVLLEAGDISVPIATTGARMEMDDSFILEGRTVLDARLTDLLTSRGTLSVFVEDGAEKYPLDGAREAAAALIETCTGKAAGAPVSETTQCEFSAWISKSAPPELPVRSGPGPDYPAVTTTPRPYTDGEEIYFPEVTVTGARDGWFQISEVITELYGGWPTDPVVTFSGEGWLPGNVLRLWLESGRLWSRPSDDAPIAATFDSDEFKIDALHACTGFWVEVEGRYRDQRLRGWTTDVCASQVTTCP